MKASSGNVRRFSQRSLVKYSTVRLRRHEQPARSHIVVHVEARIEQTRVARIDRPKTERSANLRPTDRVVDGALDLRSRAACRQHQNGRPQQRSQLRFFLDLDQPTFDIQPIDSTM